MRSKFRWADAFISASQSPAPPNPATISRPFLILFSRDADCSARSSHSRSHNLCVPATLGGTRFLACFCFTRFCFFFAMFFVFGRSWRYRQGIGNQKKNNIIKMRWGSISDVALRCLSLGSQPLLSSDCSARNRNNVRLWGCTGVRVYGYTRVPVVQKQDLQSLWLASNAMLFLDCITRNWPALRACQKYASIFGEVLRAGSGVNRLQAGCG